MKNILFKITIGIVIVMLGLLTIKITITENPSINFNDFLSNVINMSNNTIDIVQYTDFKIDGDWGIIDGLRTFINSVISILNIGVWFAQSVINVLLITFEAVRTFILN